MTEMRRTGTEYIQGAPPPRIQEPTGGVGWVLFAGVMLLLIGAYQAIAGLVAIFQDGYYLVSTNHLVLHMSYTTWGWIHICLGAVALIAGFGVMAGATWARVVGIGLAFVSAVANLAFMPAYPIWGVVVITLDVLIMYALAVHGREVQGLR